MDNSVTFTYKLVPEKVGFFVKCLDWECVFTQGDDLKECYKNAKELTEGYLEMQRDGELNARQHYKIGHHGKSKSHFQLTFDTITCKCITENIKNFAG